MSSVGLAEPQRGRYVIRDTTRVVKQIIVTMVILIVVVGVQSLVMWQSSIQNAKTNLAETALGFYVLLLCTSLATRVKGEMALVIWGLPLFLLVLWLSLDSSLLLFAIMPAVILVPSLFHVVAQARGYIFDFDKEEMRFPGGGISANRSLDYFTPWYVLQSLRRYSIKYSEIGNVIRQADDEKGIASHSPEIKIEGKFGTIEFAFDDRSKLEELNSAIIAASRPNRRDRAT